MMDSDSSIRISNPAAGFSSPDFDREKYIQKLVSECVGLSELQQQKQRLQGLSEECSTLLKRNVYHNYTPLIDTYKEISNLEDEVYQISNLLSEQRKTLLSLLDLSVVKDKTPSANPEILAVRNEKKEEQERELANFAESVEGFAEVLASGKKQFVHHCDMVELDPADSTAVGRLKGIVLVDSFILASWLPNARGNKRYQLTANYKQEEVAVVNVRDLGPVRHAFKILLPSETRVFQCADAEGKANVIKAFDDAKQARLKPSSKKPAAPAPPAPGPESPGMLERAFLEAKNAQPLLDLEENIFKEEFRGELQKLELFVVERKFEESIRTLKQLREKLGKSKYAFAEEFSKKLTTYEDELVMLLCTELEPIPGCSISKPVTVKRAIVLLTELGRSILANKCFIHYSSAILREQLRDVRLDSDVHSYVMKMASIYGESVKYTTNRLLEIRKNNLDVAYLITWARDELLDLLSVLKKQIFSSETPLIVVSQCVNSLRHHFKQLASEIGFDLSWELEAQIRSPMDRSIRATRGKFLDATKVRAQEESWKNVNLLNLASANKFKAEMDDLGVKFSLERFIKDSVQLQLTQSTYQFAKGFLLFAKAAVSMARSQDMQKLVEDILVEAGNYQFRHIEARANKKKDEKQDRFIKSNATFLLEIVIPVVETRCINYWRKPASNLDRLQQTYLHLMGKEANAASTDGFL